uniref:Bzip transcription factor n=1 Tax=Peronospora matthiolae TaxID=2874970 RepID=A0AAV1T517_9STRA
MNCFPSAPSPLVDNFVGLVHPLAPAGRQYTDVVDTMLPSPYFLTQHTASFSLGSLVDEFRAKREASGALLYLTGTTADRRMQLSIGEKTSSASSSVADNSLDQGIKPYDRRRAEQHDARRREQCRANQARYRDKQRHAQLMLEKSVGQLKNELVTLKRQVRDMSSRKRSHQSPWSITTEVFRLIEASFCSPWRMTSTREMKRYTETRHIIAVLEQPFAHDVAMGDLQGLDELLEQLRLYSHNFGTPSLQLQRIEAVTPIVMAAQATLSVTITKLTLRHVFPHLVDVSGQDRVQGDRNRLYQRLLDQRLDCSCSVTFLFDEDSDRVVRFSTSIEFIPALLRLLGDLRDVSDVLQHAKISFESVVGDVEGGSAGSLNRESNWSVS